MADAVAEHKKSWVQRGLSAGRALASVVDGFRNHITGIGTARSKVTHGKYDRDALLDWYELESLFESNDLASVVVSKIVEDSLREPFTLNPSDSKPEDDREDIRKVMAAWERLSCGTKVKEGAVFGRLFGGAGLIIVAEGGGPLAEPLDDETVRRVVELIPWDAQDMTQASWYPNGDPETYLWQPAPKQGSTPAPMLVHETRLIKFPGATTTARGRHQNRGWDHSVLQRVYSALKSFDGMFASTDAMFADASQAVFSLQGLIQGLAEADGSGAANIQSRLQLMDLMRSAARAIFLDAGDETGAGKEDFKVIERPTLAQLDGVMGQYLIRLAAAARMPLTVLLGMSPAGMDATGESDMILYYNTVDIYRREVLQPRIMRLIRLLGRQEGVDTSTWELEWPELSRPKPLDVATAEKMRIDNAIALIANQVVLPEEVAMGLSDLARTGVRGLKLDTAAREKAMKLGLEELANRELGEEEEPVGQAPAAKSSERKTPSKAAGKQV